MLRKSKCLKQGSLCRQAEVQESSFFGQCPVQRGKQFEAHVRHWFGKLAHNNYSESFWAMAHRSSSTKFNKTHRPLPFWPSLQGKRFQAWGWGYLQSIFNAISSVLFMVLLELVNFCFASCQLYRDLCGDALERKVRCRGLKLQVGQGSHDLEEALKHQRYVGTTKALQGSRIWTVLD